MTDQETDEEEIPKEERRGTKGMREDDLDWEDERFERDFYEE